MDFMNKLNTEELKTEIIAKAQEAYDNWQKLPEESKPSLQGWAAHLLQIEALLLASLENQNELSFAQPTIFLKKLVIDLLVVWSIYSEKDLTSSGDMLVTPLKFFGVVDQVGQLIKYTNNFVGARCSDSEVVGATEHLIDTAYTALLEVIQSQSKSLDFKEDAWYE